MDNICNISSSLVNRNGQFIYAGRIYTCSAGNSSSTGNHKFTSRPKCRLTRAGEK